MRLTDGAIDSSQSTTRQWRGEYFSFNLSDRQKNNLSARRKRQNHGHAALEHLFWTWCGIFCWRIHPNFSILVTIRDLFLGALPQLPVPEKFHESSYSERTRLTTGLRPLSAHVTLLPCLERTSYGHANFAKFRSIWLQFSSKIMNIFAWNFQKVKIKL